VDTKSAYGHVAAIIPAAGEGRRLGGLVPKQFLQIGGREVLARTLAVFEACVTIDDIWVVVAAEQCTACQSTIVERY
jgi:2-C-methyl-D-erythritol 4-phosphate cytidylyltransferase